MADNWRFRNPVTRSYSFFSPVHRSYSRIDYFIIDSKFLSAIKYCDYEAIVLSDHAPHLLQLAFQSKNMSPTWRFNNYITGHYFHPVERGKGPLLNVNTKLLAKILASRLEIVIPTVISPDQAGFIKNRFLFSNLHRLYNIIYSSNKFPHSPEVLLLLDAEKAFDWVEWDFLFSALQRFGFGEKFISWTKLLYAVGSHLRRSKPIPSDQCIFPYNGGRGRVAPSPPYYLHSLSSPSLLPYDLWKAMTGCIGGREYTKSLCMPMIYCCL